MKIRYKFVKERVVAIAGRAIEGAHGQLVAPVVDVIENPAVSPPRIERLQQEKFGSKLNPIPTVGPGQLDVGDPPVQGMRGIALDGQPALDPFVGSHVPETVPAGKRRSLGDLQLHDLATDRSGERQQQQGHEGHSKHVSGFPGKAAM